MSLQVAALHSSIRERIINSTHIQEVIKMAKWECSVCGYVYDPEKGDSISGIPPDIPFETLPDDWVCPACGADKDSFEKMEE